MQEFASLEEPGSTAKGKQAELIVIGKMLERGYKVYAPLVDTGIDCLVDIGEGNYKEIQIKYREDEPTFTARNFKPRDNFYIICYLSTRRGVDFWILPSKVFSEMGTRSQTKTREYVQLRMGKEGSDTYHKLRQYHENWPLLLRGATEEVRKAVESASTRIEGPHLRQREYEHAVLNILESSLRPLTRKEIVRKVYELIHGRFSKLDRARVRTGGERWKDTAEWAISRLKREGLITAEAKNQYVITEDGRIFRVDRYEEDAPL
jgi:hypothetical protein